MTFENSNIQLGIRLLRDAAEFFEALGDNNAPLEDQMNENASVFRNIAQLLDNNPMGNLNGSPYVELAGKLLQDAAGFFLSLADQNEPLREQIVENSNVYKQIGEVIQKDPLGYIDNRHEPAFQVSHSDEVAAIDLDEVFNFSGRFRKLDLIGERTNVKVACHEIKPSHLGSHEKEVALEKNMCDFCGFSGEKYFFKISISRRNHSESEQFTACMLCSLCVRPQYAVDHEAASFAWAPEFSQAGIVRLFRDIFVLRIRAHEGEIARRALRLLEMREQVAHKKFGKDSPEGFLDILPVNDNEDIGIRLIPRSKFIARKNEIEFNRFPQLLAYWKGRDQPYNSLKVPEAERRIKLFVEYEEARLESLGLGADTLHADDLRQSSNTSFDIAESDSNFDEMFQLGVKNYNDGNFVVAEEKLKAALSVGHQEFGDSNSKVGATSFWLAYSLDAQSKCEVAEEFHRMGIKVAERVFGPRHNACQNYRLGLAENLQLQNKYVEAEDVHRRGIHLIQKSKEVSNGELGNAWFRLGKNLLHQEKIPEAAEIFQTSLGLREEHFGTRSKEVTWAKLAVAQCLTKELDFEGADTIYGEVFEYARVLFSDVPKDTAILMKLIAHFREIQGKHKESEVYLREALMICNSKLKASDLLIGDLRHSLSINLVHQGRIVEAEAEVKGALENVSVHAKHNNWRLALASSTLAQIFDLSGKVMAAKSIHHKATDELTKALGTSHLFTLSSMLLLAENFRLRNDAESTLKICESVISATKNNRYRFPQLGRAYFRRAAAVRTTKETALENIDQALVNYSRSLGKSHAWVCDATALRETILTG